MSRIYSNKTSIRSKTLHFQVQIFKFNRIVNHTHNSTFSRMQKLKHDESQNPYGEIGSHD